MPRVVNVLFIYKQRMDDIADYLLRNGLLKEKDVQTDNKDWLHRIAPQELQEEFNAAKEQRYTLPCHETIATLPAAPFNEALSRLLAERIEEKRKIIEHTFTQCDQRWDDTLLKIAIRSFGFGIQSAVFEE
jgi:hypothetical protein